MGPSMSGSGSQGSWSSGSASSNIRIPKELRPLYGQTAQGIQSLQSSMPLWGNAAQSKQDYTAANPMQVAGADPLQNWVAENVTRLQDTPEAENIAKTYGLLAPQVAREKATGANLANDPAVLAASGAFEKMLLPMIQNQMGLAGLGDSSSLANSLALAKTNYTLPMVQSAIQREQDAINNQANLYASLMPQFTAMGGAETARLSQALDAAGTTGATMRGIAQEPLTAQYQDFLRRQALAEQSLFVPFGATASPSIGPSAQSQQSSQSWGNTSQNSGGGFK